MFSRDCQGLFYVDGRDTEIIEVLSHPNAGIYAYKIRDAQGRVCVVPSEDVLVIYEEEVWEEYVADIFHADEEFIVDGKPVEIVNIYRDDTTGALGYLVQFPDGSKAVVDHVDVQPLGGE